MSTAIDYCYCASCGEIFDADAMSWTHDNKLVCDKCFDSTSFTCTGCGKTLSNVFYEADGLCDECDEATEQGALADEDYEPNEHLIFFTSGAGDNEDPETAIYISIALQYEYRYRSWRNDGAKLWNAHSPAGRWIVRHTCETEVGYEAVSQPHTLNAWREQRESIAKLLAGVRETWGFVDEDTQLYITVYNGKTRQPCKTYAFESTVDIDTLYNCIELVHSAHTFI